MAITINSNISSLTTQRRLGDTTAGLTRSFERLSSGLRINRASDDAAGLAIADNLKTDNRVFNQGIRNLNDGLSLLNVADGALTELSNIVVRIRELAEQSANGTLSKTQREAIDQEAQELSDEFTRIAQTTEVNGLKLFDGSLGELSLQAGYGERGAVTSTLGGAIGDGTFATGVSYAVGDDPSDFVAADFNNDGLVDLAISDSSAFGLIDGVNVLLGNGDGSFTTIASYRINVVYDPDSLVTADLNGDGVLDLVADARPVIGRVSVFIGRGDGTFEEAVYYNAGASPDAVTLADVNGDDIPDILASADSDDSINILLGVGMGPFLMPFRIQREISRLISKQLISMATEPLMLQLLIWSTPR